MSDSLWPHEPQHARLLCPSPTPGVHPNPCPSSPWFHPTISSSVVHFSSCPQSSPASGSFPMSRIRHLVKGASQVALVVKKVKVKVKVTQSFPTPCDPMDCIVHGILQARILGVGNPTCQYRRHKRQGFDPWFGKIPWRRESYLLQYSGLENSMDYTVHGVANRWTLLSDFHFHFLI